MTQVRQKLSQLLQTEVELKFFIATFYSKDGLKDLDNDTLLARGKKLADHVFAFSLAWLNLSSIGIKIRSEDAELQKDIQGHVESLKATAEQVKGLYADISKLQLPLEIRQSYEVTQGHGLPLIYDFTSIQMPHSAFSVLAASTFLFGVRTCLDQMRDDLASSLDELKHPAPDHEENVQAPTP